MRTILWRATAVSVAQLLLFELLQQLEVRLDWRESTAELAGLGLVVLLLAGLVWAVLPLCRRTREGGGLASAVGLGIGLFVGLHIVTYYYSWHIRPNVGLYREPGWVTQHPGFQQELRQRIEGNLWFGSK